MKNLSEIGKEFNKKFLNHISCNNENCICKYQYVIKDFIYLTIGELLEQIVPEKSQREYDFSIGFNACRSEVKNRIKIVLK